MDTWHTFINEFSKFQRVQGLRPETIRTRKEHLEYLARGIRKPINEVVTADLFEHLAAQNWAQETRRSRRTTYRAFWRFLESQHNFEDIAKAIPKIKAGIGIPRPCPEHSYRVALQQADRRERLALRLAAEHGLRRAEVAQAHKNHLTTDLIGFSLIVTGKGGKSRLVPLNNEVAAEIQAMPNGYLFPGQIDGHISPRWIGKLISRLLPPNLTMHTLRHRFATVALDRTNDLFAVQELLGHSSAETTKRYCKIDTRKLRVAIEAAA